MSAEQRTGAPVGSTVVLVEPNPDGHRLFYVRLLVERLVALGHRPVLLTSPEALTAPEFQVHLQRAVADGLDVATGDCWLRPASAVRGHYLARAEALAGAGGRVVVADGDLWLASCIRHRVGQRFSVTGAQLRVLLMRPPVAGLRPSSTAGIRAGIKTALIVAAMAAGVRAQALRSAGAPAQLPRLVSGMPQVVDPVDMPFRATDRPRLRERLGLPAGRRVAVIAGSLTARKGVGVVLDAWTLLAAGPAGTARSGGTGGSAGTAGPADPPTLLLVGRADKAVQRQLDSAVGADLRERGLLLVRNEYVTDDELNAYIASANCVILAYENEAPSGILGKAAVAGVPVLAAGSAQVRAETIRLAVGLGVPSTPEHIAAGVTELLRGPETIAADPALQDADPSTFADRLCGLGASTEAGPDGHVVRQ